MNSPTQTILLVLILIAASTAAIAPFAQPSGGGDTAKLEADIAALNADVDALSAQVTALSAQVTTLNEKADVTISKIDSNQASNVAAFNQAFTVAQTNADVVNNKLDQLLALHASVPPPVEDSYTATVKWDYNHTDDGKGPITGFNIQRSDDGGTTWTDYVQVPGADVRSYEDKPIRLGENKCYRVLAFRVREGGAVIDYSVEPSNAACSTSPTPPTS
jgi:cell division protein FtsB